MNPSVKDRHRAVRRALYMFYHHQTGIHFEALVQFAQPLFELYNIPLPSTPDDLEEFDLHDMTKVLATLETSRLLWAYFLLDEEAQYYHLSELSTRMIGLDASLDAYAHFVTLLDLMAEGWQEMTPPRREAAMQVPGYRLPNFETLMAAYAPGKAPHNMYVPSLRTNVWQSLAAFTERPRPEKRFQRTLLTQGTS